MKSYFWRRAATVAGIILLAALIFGSFQFRAQALQGGQALPNNGGQAISADVTPQAVLNAMQRVADWQLAHSSDNTRGPTDWVASVGDAGLMALEGISGDAKYRDAMLGIAEANHWQLGPRTYMADDQAVGQTYAELYFLYRDPKMIAPMREQFDAILAKPPATASLDFSQPGHGQDCGRGATRCSWRRRRGCGFTPRPDDERYLDFAVTNWWRTTDYLYDKDEHLFFRDSTYFKKREANGAKGFLEPRQRLGDGRTRAHAAIPADESSRPSAVRAIVQGDGGEDCGVPAAGRTVAREPARPGELSGQGNERVGIFHLRAGVGRESRPARPREIRAGGAAKAGRRWSVAWTRTAS